PHRCLSRYHSRFYPLLRPTHVTLLLWSLATSRMIVSDRSSRNCATTSQKSQQAAPSSASPLAILLLLPPIDAPVASISPPVTAVPPSLTVAPLPTKPLAAAAPCCTSSLPALSRVSAASFLLDHCHCHQQLPPR
ncbi:hypothetical protein GW17_00013350, partial [Ensete ventricosum]